MADPKYVHDFIEEMTPYAVAVGDRYGIDPVTIITQAAIETGWGREVAGNNYFGIKSHGKPGGQNITTHEEINGKRTKVRDNFRVYRDLGESVADYGRFLSENPRYAEALTKDEYRGQLSGITEAGYATDGNYKKLVHGVSNIVSRNLPPLPPAEIPSVATLTDTVRPRPLPITPSIDMAQMRSRPPTNLIGDSFAQLPRPSGSNLADSLALSPIPGGRQTAQPFDAAFDTRSGAMRMLAQPETVSSQGLGIGTSRAPVALPRPRPQTAPPDLISRSMQNIASANPTRLPPIAPSRSSAPSPVAQSVDLRQSRLPLPSANSPPSRVTVSTAYTTPQSQIERGAPRVAQSPIGQPPTTRRVASVPMPALRPTIPQSFAGQEGGAPRMTTAIPGPNNPTIKGQERLAASSPYPPANYGGVTNVALPPTPRPTIARAPTPAPPYRAVADALDVRPAPPLPRPRPNLGMGGVDIAPVAPVPMPRLDRPGIFGKPQIFGRDIPLPGIVGVIQNVTKAMNNASGPFNNGADNLIYNTLRGGDFNTPGAATVQSGGYLFAPKPGGGYINVGRVNRGISAADDYAQRNANNHRPMNAYDRMKSSQTGNDTPLSVMES